jgi:ankyrin repeat protein
MPDGIGALLLAARSGRTAMAVFLSEKGADPNANAAGYTALHAAVLMGDLDVVKALVARGANPNIQLTKAAPVRRGNQELALPVALMGATPFLLAAKFADVEILRVLAAAGGNPGIAMKSGTTPLMAAAGFGMSAGGGNRRGVGNRYTTVESSNDEEKEALDAVRILLDLGADVNGADPSGNTALHGAAAQGYKTVVQYLVDKGGNLAAKNKRGQSPAGILQKPAATSREF